MGRHAHMWLVALLLTVLVRVAAWAQEVKTGAEFYERKASWRETMLDVRARYGAWKAEQEALRAQLQFGPWYATAPIKADKLSDAGFPEQGVDLEATDAQGPLWHKHEDWTDGRVVNLPEVDSVLTYLYRTIRSERAARLAVSLGSDDGLVVWLNGATVLEHDVSRGAAPDQELITLDLQPGENRLLMKIHNGNGGHAFYFSTEVKPLAGIWKQFERDFPMESSWLRSDLPGGRHLEWFGAGPDGATSLMREAAGRALALAHGTLDLVERSAPRPEYAGALGALEQRIAAARTEPDADWPALYVETRQLRRRIILSHPLLEFDALLISKRPPPLYSHMVDQYLGRHSRSGPGLVVLSSWKDSPKATVLLEGKLPEGSVLHPDLSFDGRRVLFSFCDHTVSDPERRRFFIYEAAVDGSWVRQVTGTPTDPLEGAGGRRTVLIEDFDPCYLPDGGFAFVSTRNQAYGRCHGGRYTPSYVLYRGELDGSGIRRLSFGEANEWDPAVLDDGRIVYSRWDYINRHDTIYQGLWVTRPDGTATAHYYGNYTANPCMVAEPHPIAGSHKVAATVMAHHSYTSGSIIVLDPRRGEDGDAPITRVTPEAAFPETEGWPEGAYATPYPLSEELFLAAYTPDQLVSQGSIQRANAYAIYLVDAVGGRELIYSDPDTSCFSPIPIQPRQVPPAFSSMVAGKESQTTGRFFVQNVYDSTEEIQPGSISALRVVELIPQPTPSVPDRSYAANEVVKRILGTIPIDDDGSAAFEVPAGTPLQFQILDGNGMAVLTMRSQVYLQPGELMSCAGCHEPRRSAARLTRIPHAVTFRSLDPPAGPQYDGGLSFARTVQPVLDRNCIRCHGLDRKAAGIDLLGTPQHGRSEGTAYATQASHGFSVSYRALMGREGAVALAQRNTETVRSKPTDYFAHAGRLAPMLLKDHHGVRLDRASFQRIVGWLDLNAQFYGDYSYNRVEGRTPSPEGERALRAHVREVFGAELAEQPFAALVNVAMPTESRILKAPLAVEAGGWGQVEGGWTSTDDQGCQTMLKLVEAAVGQPPGRDVAGTCGHEPCDCGACWVAEAEKQYRESLQPKAE